MTTAFRRIPSAIKRHEHACTFYNTLDELKDIAVPYLLKGFERGEKCMYMVDDHEPDEIRDVLSSNHVDPLALEKKGLLEVLRMRDTYFAFNIFNRVAMLTFYRAYLPSVFKEGFQGLRVVGEVSDGLLSTAAEREFLEYENGANELFDDYPVMSICAYNRSKFPASYLEDVRTAHPFEAVTQCAFLRHDKSECYHRQHFPFANAQAEKYCFGSEKEYEDCMIYHLLNQQKQGK